MRRILSGAAAFIIVLTVALASPSGAAPVAATATDVSTSAMTSCGDNPSFDVSGSTVGDGFGSDGWGTVAGDPVPVADIDVSPLYDDWTATASDWGIGFPGDADPGTIRGLYAVVGTPDLAPATSIEWFVLYSCATPGTDSVVLLECLGQVGTCPRSVDEAMGFGATVSPTDPGPGDDVMVAAEGCVGGTIGALLYDGDEVLVTRADPQPGVFAGVTATLGVPPTATVGSTLHVVVVCSIDGVAPIQLDLVVAGGPSTTATTDPTTVAPVGAVRSPRFTG